MNKLSEKSLTRLNGVSPLLVKVVKRAIELSAIDFRITEGVRSIERQCMLFAAGKSQTMQSKHLIGEAIDLAALVGGVVSWEWKYYEIISTAMKQAAKELSVTIEWGGDWKSLKDGVHFQLKG